MFLLGAVASLVLWRRPRFFDFINPQGRAEDETDGSV